MKKDKNLKFSTMKLVTCAMLSMSVTGSFAASVHAGAPAAQSPAATATSQGQSFQSWLQNFRAEAARSGVSQQTIDSALNGATPIQRVIDLDRKQPEKKLTFAEYKSRTISQARIDEGRSLLRQHWNELKEVERQYGVAPQYVVALWGMESNFGQNTGGFSVIDALATLAWDGRRADFFKNELLKALKIIDQGHITAAQMKGSWAGAMGQNQFMPSSFLAYAVDHNKDGRKDIWTSKSDVFGSTANYLKTVGWKSDESWGRAVSVSSSVQATLDAEQGVDLRKRVVRSLQEWKDLGVTLPNGQPIPVVAGMKASVVQPDGRGTQAYIIYDNYRVFMHWNKSVYFATSVGLLADLIAKGAPQGQPNLRP